MSYALRVYSNILDGAGFSFVSDLTGVGNWKRSIRANGGSWQGEVNLTGNINSLAERFYTWLGYHVEETCRGVKTWSGLVYEMELSYSGITRRRSLDLMANYISVYYVDPARVEHQTAWASQAQSIARYGRKEEIDWLDDMTAPAAVAQRDRMLAEMAWPWARPLSISTPGEVTLTVVVCGYAFTSNWRYATQNTEFDTEQGALTYAATTFTDAGQDFSDWVTAAPGTAQHSIWVTNSDRTMTWAYIGPVNGGNTVIDVYTDQGLSIAGWNGAGIVDKTPSTYYVRGGASAFVGDIASADCEYLSIGHVETNYVQVNRILQREQRAWDVMMDVVDLGDASGNPYRLYVTPDRYLMYEQISTTPRYYIEEDGIHSAIGSPVTVLPWLVTPSVFRDMNFKTARSEAGSWLDDARDIYVSEVEVDQDGKLTLKADLYSEGDLLAELAKQQAKYPSRPLPEK